MTCIYIHPSYTNCVEMVSYEALEKTRVAGVTRQITETAPDLDSSEIMPPNRQQGAGTWDSATQMGMFQDWALTFLIRLARLAKRDPYKKKYQGATHKFTNPLVVHLSFDLK